MTWPNRITLGRILLIGPFVILLLNLHQWPWARWAALVVFALMAISDALDGYLARRTGTTSAFGRFLDPLADKLLVSCSVILLAIDRTSVTGLTLPNWVPVIAIGKDLVITLGFLVIYGSTGRIFIQPRALGKWCTVLQLATVISVLLAPDFQGGFRVVPQGLWWLASAAAVLATADYLRLGIRFVSGALEPTQVDKS